MLLSELIGIPFSGRGMFRSCKTFLTQMASLEHNAMATYPASIADEATMLCNFDFQINAVFPIVKTILVVDFRLSLSPAQSASQHSLMSLNDSGNVRVQSS